MAYMLIEEELRREIEQLKHFFMNSMANEPIQNGKNMTDHFVEATEMVVIGKGAMRRQKSYRLSRYACLLISMSLSSKKENALPALEYFSGKQIKSQLRLSSFLCGLFFCCKNFTCWQ